MRFSEQEGRHALRWFVQVQACRCWRAMSLGVIDERSCVCVCVCVCGTHLAPRDCCCVTKRDTRKKHTNSAGTYIFKASHFIVSLFVSHFSFFVRLALPPPDAAVLRLAGAGEAFTVALAVTVALAGPPVFLSLAVWASLATRTRYAELLATLRALRSSAIEAVRGLGGATPAGWTCRLSAEGGRRATQRVAVCTARRAKSKVDTVGQSSRRTRSQERIGATRQLQGQGSTGQAGAAGADGGAPSSRICFAMSSRLSWAECRPLIGTDSGLVSAHGLHQRRLFVPSLSPNDCSGHGIIV